MLLQFHVSVPVHYNDYIRSVSKSCSMPQDKLSLAPPIIAMSIQERDLLYKLYVERNKSAGEIAAKYGVSVRYVYMRLKQHAITKEGYVKPLPVYCPLCGQHWTKRKRRQGDLQ
jgi:hypothetical protein